MKYIFLITTLLAISFQSFATTWNEPWQKEIIRKAEYFVKAEVITSSDSMITLNIESSIGETLEGEIIVNDFFLIEICSWSGGHGPEFRFEKGVEGYFFLKKGEDNNYQIPTPTSGFNMIRNNEVQANYRHSYHKALVPLDLYELTYTQIWNKYHGETVDDKAIVKFIDQTLSKEPAGFEEDEINLFFKQHVALETAYLLELNLDFEVLKKFSESDNFHSKISSIRAMSHQNTTKTVSYLFDFIESEENEDFTKVIAIWTLLKFENDDVYKRLVKLKKKLSEESTSFGGNIMDPRVCTFFPSPKGAVVEKDKREELLLLLQNI